MKTFSFRKEYVYFPYYGAFRQNYYNFSHQSNHSKIVDEEFKEVYLGKRDLINFSLRNNFVSKITFGYIEKYITMINKNSKIYNNLIMMRGIRNKDDLVDSRNPTRTHENLKIGDIIEDPGTAAKTDSFWYADEYTNSSKGYILVIYYPGESRHYKVTHHESHKVGVFSSRYRSISFNEYVTFPGERFQILDKGKYKGTTVYYAEYIGNLNLSLPSLIKPHIEFNLEFIRNLPKDKVYFSICKNETFIFRHSLQEGMCSGWDSDTDEDCFDIDEIFEEYKIMKFSQIERSYLCGLIPSLYQCDNFMNLYLNIAFNRGMDPVGYTKKTGIDEENIVFASTYGHSWDEYSLDYKKNPGGRETGSAKGEKEKFFKAYFKGEITKIEIGIDKKHFDIPNKIL